jgi:Rrf2 family iron-sulfur cluster assembly transcriptional regulator
VRPFTRSTEYAIRALTFLAKHRGEGQFHLAREMSEVLGIPAPFLGKILQPLVMRNVLESQRGRNGGFRLLPDAMNVTLLDIANSQELINENRKCFLGQAECTDERACPMHDYWRDAAAAFEQRMRLTTLSELTEFSNSSRSSNYPLPDDLQAFSCSSPESEDEAQSEAN